MGKLNVQGIVYDNPKQTDQSSNFDPTTGRPWSNGNQDYTFTVPSSPPTFKVGNTPLTPGSQSVTSAMGNPQPGSFDATPAKANPVVFNQDPVVAGKGQPITVTKDASGKTLTAHGQIPNSSVVFNSPA
jgi:hypothetical protein